MLQRLELENFTAFDKLDMHFSSGVNLFIGDNGTGKTHILKLLYTPLSALKEDKRISDKIVGVFLPKERRIGRLVKRVKSSARAKIRIYNDNERLSLSFSNHTKEMLKWTNKWNIENIKSSVYIPVKEMLANAPGFLSLYAKRDLHFEEVYADILYKAFIPPLRGPASGERQKALKIIRSVIEGNVIIKNEQFFLKNKNGELEFTLLAEGMRKLGLLWLLIQNGTFFEGSTLFWDEPEANLNPSMLKPLVEILLQLQRTGVQIFIATHNYVLLSEFDLQKTVKDKVRFFTLNRDDETKEIVHQYGDNYLDVIPNKISDAYTAIYDAKIKESLGGKSK